MTERVAQVLGAQRDFVANASHQLRTPLTGLRLRLESAAVKSEDPRVRRDLEAAERESERLARLLNGLLALAREDSSPAGSAPVPLGEHVAAALERWRGPAAARDGQLVFEGGEPAQAFVAQDDLAVVLDNLIENALDYGGERPTVTIAWTRVPGAVRLTVADDGPGVPRGEEERLFERFRRAAPQGLPGTGLGLPIVRALAERWGGTATIRNGESGGACAEVQFRAASGGLPDLDPQLDDALPAGG
jgi:signal transduction histidine kinase